MLSLQVSGNLGELVEGGLEVLGYFKGDDVGVGQVGRVLQAVVFQPENVQIDFVTFEKVFVGKGLEAFGLFARMTVLCMVAADEVI